MKGFSKWLAGFVIGIIAGWILAGLMMKAPKQAAAAVVDDTTVELRCENYGTDPNDPKGKVTLFCEFEKKGVL